MAVQWETVHWFGPEEFPEPDKMHEELIARLDWLRTTVGSPILVTPGGATTGAHETNSLHYRGMAADIMCPRYNVLTDPKSLRAFVLQALKLFPRVGFYPGWTWDHPRYGRLGGGLHVDIGDREGRPPTIWWRDRHGIYHYPMADAEQDVFAIAQTT